MIKKNSYQDSNIDLNAKILYLENHGFSNYNTIFLKNRIYIRLEQVPDLTFQDLQKYVYLANNHFEIKENKKMIDGGMIAINFEDFINSDMKELYQAIKETFIEVRDTKSNLIN